MLSHFDEYSGMLRIGQTCRASTFLYRQAGRDRVDKWRVATWEIPTSARSSQASRDDGEEGKSFFPGFQREYHGVYSVRKSLRSTGLKDRKDQLCKEQALFPNNLSHPATVFSCSNRSQLQRLETL